MAITKMNDKTINYIMIGLGILIILYLISNYSNKQNNVFSNYQGINSQQINPSNIQMIDKNSVAQQAKQNVTTPKPVDNLQDNLNAPASINTSNQISNKEILNPDQLLPNDSNNTWASSTPPNNELKNINLLSSGQLIGINTVGSSLRNPNLQLRAEPPNPRNNNLCPWNMSTIEADIGNGIKVC